MVGTQYIFLVECAGAAVCSAFLSTIRSLEKRIHAQAVENKCATVYTVLRVFPSLRFEHKDFYREWKSQTEYQGPLWLRHTHTQFGAVETNSTAIVLLLRINFLHNVNTSIFDQLHQWHAGSDAINHLWFDLISRNIEIMHSVEWSIYLCKDTGVVKKFRTRNLCVSRLRMVEILLCVRTLRTHKASVPNDITHFCIDITKNGKSCAQPWE